MMGTSTTGPDEEGTRHRRASLAANTPRDSTAKISRLALCETIAPTSPETYHLASEGDGLPGKNASLGSRTDPPPPIGRRTGGRTREDLSRPGHPYLQQELLALLDVPEPPRVVEARSAQVPPRGVKAHPCQPTRVASERLNTLPALAVP